MKVKFNHPRGIDGKTYEAGQEHELHDSTADHWYFKALVKNGDAHVVEGPSSVKSDVAHGDGGEEGGDDQSFLSSPELLSPSKKKGK
jgi:hypothetical protein